MSRRMMSAVVAGGALATTVMFSGVAFAADYPGMGGGNNGGGQSTPGGTGNGTGGNGGGTVGNGTGGSGSGVTSTSSNGGGVNGTSGSGSGTSGNLPFTGFELATVLTLGVGAIGAGGTVVLASRKRRDTSAVA